MAMVMVRVVMPVMAMTTMMMVMPVAVVSAIFKLHIAINSGNSWPLFSIDFRRCSCVLGPFRPRT